MSIYPGVAVALGELHRLHGEATMVCDVMRGLGLTLADLQKAGADDYDIAEIRKCLEQGNAEDRAQVAGKVVASYGKGPMMAALPILKRDNAEISRALATGDAATLRKILRRRVRSLM